MKKLVIPALLCASALAANAAHASGLGDKLGSFVGSSAGSSSNSSVSGLSALGLGSMTSPGTASNAAGIISYCVKNNYLGADKAARVKSQLLGKMGLGQHEEPKDEGYKNGLVGMITGSNGQSFSLDSVKSKAREKACDYVLENAASLL